MKIYRKITTAINKEALMVAREEKGYSQKEVAEAIGIYPGTYFNWEAGDTKRADTEKYKKVCELLEIEGEI